MDSESGSVDWVANLRNQFYSLCAEADAIIVQEPMEFVRNQFLTAGESIKQFCSELVEDAKAVFPEQFNILLECPKQEENADTPCPKMSTISIDDDQEVTSPVTSLSLLLPTEPDFSDTEKGNIGNVEKAKFPVEVEEDKLPGDEVTSSTNTEATHSYDNDSVMSECESRNELLQVENVAFSDTECTVKEEARESYVADLSKENNPTSGDQKLDESLIVVDSCEFRSDYVIKKPYRHTYQKIMKKFRKKRSYGSECGVVDAEKDGKEWERLDEEDVSDSDWEIV